MELYMKVGDLLDEAADAILVSANPQLNLSGGVGGAILARGNERVQEELRERLRALGAHFVAPGTVVETSAGNLRARVLLHCVAVDGFYGSSPDLVGRVVVAALRRAAELGCHTAAMPAVATGYGPLSMAEFARGLKAAVDAADSPLERLTLVVRREEDLAEVRLALGLPAIRTLFRPVGLHEMALIAVADDRAFPPRLPEQPIFYPVLEREYAVQIARDWNTKDEASGFAGYVTEFDVGAAYVDEFEEHVVGASAHRELWIPAETLPEFNRHLLGRIRMRDAFFGDRFTGHVPTWGGTKGRNAREQFLILAATLEHSAFDMIDVVANPTYTYLHFPFWVRQDFGPDGVPPDEKASLLRFIAEQWRRAYPDRAILGAATLAGPGVTPPDPGP